MVEQLSEGGVMRDRTRDLIERTVGLSKVCTVSGGINITNVSLLEALLDAARSEGPRPESAEALPVVSDEMVEAGMNAIRRVKWGALKMGIAGNQKTAYAKREAIARACLEAVLLSRGEG